MPHTTQRVCFTPFETTKPLCITLPTLEGLKSVLAKFHPERITVPTLEDLKSAQAKFHPERITLPTLEGSKLALVKFHREVLFRHPYTSAGILLLWSFYPKLPFNVVYYIFYLIPRAMILNCIGFGGEGVRHDSYASRYQSRVYGGEIPRNSHFSTYQSYGATENKRHAKAKAGTGFVGFLWWVFGSSCKYAALVMLLKYDYDAQ